MAVQIPDPGTGNGQTGDNEYVFRKKVKDNFSDQTNAANRLVGTAAGNVMEVGAFGVGATIQSATSLEANADTAPTQLSAMGDAWNVIHFKNVAANSDLASWSQLMVGRNGAGPAVKVRMGYHGFLVESNLYGTHNATKDANGFLKGASPVIDMYDTKIGLNHDAEQQGGITFEKLGIGDYLIKGSLGFAQEGWYIETPKDANGNVLVAVVYKQLENNDLSIKTYAKKFDDETGDIVPNLLKPRDIPAGRFISLRLHELPKEPQPEV